MLTIFEYFFLISILIILILINNKYRFYIGNFIGLIDRPDKNRKFHNSDTPLIGLFPLILVLIIYTKFFYKDDLHFSNILLISCLFFIMGIVDDIFNVSYKNKFLLSIILLSIFLLFNKNFLITKILFETILINKNLINVHSIILTIVCMLILTNAFNFTDGINGLSSIIASLWLLGLSALGLKINFHLIFLSIIIFLNAIPVLNGKYFIGDNGTLFLGTLIGFETIHLFNNNLDNISYEQIFIIFMIPGFDMIRLIFQRILNKKNPFLPDNNHLHHLLIKKYSLTITLTIYSGLIIFPILIDYFFTFKSIFIITLTSLVYVYILKKLKVT